LRVRNTKLGRIELQENNWKLDYKIGIKKPYMKSAVGCRVWWCPLKFKVGKDLMLGMGQGVCIEVTRAMAPTEARAAQFLTGFPPEALPFVFLNCRKRVLKSYFISVPDHVSPSTRWPHSRGA